MGPNCWSFPALWTLWNSCLAWPNDWLHSQITHCYEGKLKVLTWRIETSRSWVIPKGEVFTQKEKARVKKETGITCLFSLFISQKDEEVAKGLPLQPLTSTPQSLCGCHLSYLLKWHSVQMKLRNINLNVQSFSYSHKLTGYRMQVWSIRSLPWEGRMKEAISNCLYYSNPFTIRHLSWKKTLYWVLGKEVNYLRMWVSAISLFNPTSLFSRA